MNPEPLDDLLMRWSFGLLTDVEAEQLDALLKENPAARLRLRRSAALDERMAAWQAGGLSTAWNEALGAEPSVAKPLGFPRSAGGLALAASLAVVAAATAWLLKPGLNPAAEQSVEANCAVLAQAIGARWQGAGRSLTSGAGLAAEKLHLTEGLARLEFYSGASVTLEGDAAIELRSAWEARLAHGKARIHVPPAARGFALLTDQGKVVDLGTDYGLDVAPGGASAELHVFDGKVELHRAGSPLQNLFQGEAVLADAGGVTRLDATASERFTDSRQLDALRFERDAARSTTWSAQSLVDRRDARLVAYFPFQRLEGERSRSLFNLAEPPGVERNRERDGGIVGAAWSEGRWPGKDALEFKRPGDRVRLSIGSEYQAVSAACWARIDSLDRKYNALLLTDGYDHGEIHWQIYEDGRLMFSIQTGDNAVGRPHNEIVYSEPFYTSALSGQWFHLAFTYDNARGEVCQYVNGAARGRSSAPDHYPARAVAFGPCEIGNWGLPTLRHQHPVRNLNGRIDEFALWSEVLSPDEIAKLYEQGKPE